ncbi:APC family permease [Streptomyces inhibens]|uniref:APC family permease n=1 Tax=Streptomyces inhibens TaxID=2293571 RepID=UPI003673EB8D
MSESAPPVGSSPSTTATAIATAAPSSGLKRNALGVATIAFLVISAAGPLGYLGGTAPLMITLGGTGAPAAFLFAGITLALFLIGFTAMTPHVKNEGAFYAYISTGMGRAAGAVGAIFALLAYNLILIATLGVITTYINPVIESVTGYGPPWPVTATAIAAAVFALGTRGIDVGARVLGVLLALEAALLAALAVAVIVQGGADGISAASLTPSEVSAPGMGAVLALGFIGFLGIEGTALYRSEARDPEQTIPRASYLAVGVITVFYCFVTWAVIQAFGTGTVAQAANTYGAQLFFVAAEQYLGLWASYAMNALILTSLLAAQLAFHNAANRYMHSLALDQMLPPVLARTASRTYAPWVAGLAQLVASLLVLAITGMVGLDPYREMSLWLAALSVVLIVLLQIMTCVAVVVFFRRQGGAVVGAVRGVVAPVAAALLLGAALWLLLRRFDLLTLAGSGVNTVLLTVLAGLIVLTLLWAGLTRRLRPERLALVGVREPDPQP